MTKHELAIIMTFTGTTTLKGEDFNIFHKYVESLMGRPVFIHELPSLADELKHRSLADFINLCATATDDEVVKEN